jgi:signal peptidase I
MTATEWLLFIVGIQIIHFLGTHRLYVKAGRKPWEAIVPIYNAIVLMQIIRRPKWWVILLFIPIINLMMFPVVWVETLRSFGKHENKDTLLGILTFGFYLFIVNYDSNTSYDKDRDLNSKTWFGEWISALLFAIIAATIVHNYFIQPYIIPTGSLEKTLLIGDFLFVSKFHYGARTPTSAVAFPYGS